MDWTRNDHGIFGRMDVRRESECYFLLFLLYPLLFEGSVFNVRIDADADAHFSDPLRKSQLVWIA